MTRRLRSPSRGLLAALIVVLTGCTVYEPVSAPTPRSTVRARLTVEEAVRWSDLYGEPVRTLQGRVVRHDADALHLDVLLARSASEFRRAEFRDTLVIPARGLESVSTRRVSPWRTALVAAAAVGASFLFVDQVLVGGSEETPPDDGGGTQSAVVPLLRIPIGR